MGHLINPIGFRVGWSTNWADSWYTEFSYYPEFLHEILRLRLYIEYVANSDKFEKSSIIFSHCELDLRCSTLFVRIFLYDGSMFAEFEKRINVWKNFIRRGILPPKLKKIKKEQVKTVIPEKFSYDKKSGAYRGFKSLQKRKRVGFFNIVLFNSLFHFIDKERCRGWDNLKQNETIIKPLGIDRRSWIFFQKRRLKSLVYHLNKSNDLEFKSTLKRLFFLLRIRPNLRPVIQSTCLFLLIFKSFVKISQSFAGLSRRKLYLTNYFRLYYFTFSMFFMFAYYKHFFRLFSSFLGCIFAILNNSFNIKIELFYLDNVSVTAKLIARYFCRRLVQGYRFYQILNPLMRELKRVSVISRGKFSFYAKKGIRQIIPKSLMNYKSDSLKILLKHYFYIFKTFFFKFFVNKNTWFNCTFLLFSSYFSSNIFSHSLSNYIKYQNFFIGISKTFFYRMPSFLAFFDYSSFLNSVRIYSYFEKFFINFFYNIKGSFLFFKAFDYLYSGFSILLQPKVSPFNFEQLLICNAYYNRFLTGSFLSTFFQYLLDFNHINNAKIRRELKTPFLSCLMGFKIHCRGRLSRKQIASSLKFNYGNVPLNTISSVIDYGFSTIALHNSLISMKIWFYKSNNAVSWFYKQS